jgi:hypothetical protein
MIYTVPGIPQGYPLGQVNLGTALDVENLAQFYTGTALWAKTTAGVELTLLLKKSILCPKFPPKLQVNSDGERRRIPC